MILLLGVDIPDIGVVWVISRSFGSVDASIKFCFNLFSKQQAALIIYESRSVSVWRVFALSDLLNLDAKRHIENIPTNAYDRVGLTT